MPDIIKGNGFVLGGDAVRIPDFCPPPPPVPEEPLQEEEQEEEGPGGGGEEEDNPAPPPPPPEPELPTREEMAAQYRQQLQEVAREAAKKAYSDALQEKRAELQRCIDEVASRLGEMQQLQSQYLTQYTQELKYMAVDIAEKFTLHKIDENDTVLADLVMQAVGSIKNSNWLKVEVSDRLVGLVELLKEELRRPEYQGKAEVSPIAAPKDTCRVTTEDGTVVATISVQADNLRDIFSKV